jgi:hypothetical protein
MRGYKRIQENLFIQIKKKTEAAAMYFNTLIFAGEQTSM